MLDFRNKHTMIFGLKGQGKSNWLQYQLSESHHKNHMLYDMCQEHNVESFNRYLPTYRQGSEAKAEFQGVTERLITNVEREKRPEIYAIEEINRLAPSSGGTPEALMELIDLNRHYGIGIVGIARRPASVETDLTELADQIIIFRLTGKNDYRRLENEVPGLGDAARELDDYHYLLVESDRTYSVKSPVPEMDTTGRL